VVFVTKYLDDVICQFPNPKLSIMMLNQVICFENECCSIEHDPAVPCLIMNWKGLLPSRAFREVHLEALNLIREHKITKVMGDARRMKTIGSEDVSWMENFWIPCAIAAGYRYNAIVESNYIFNQQSIYNLIEKANKELVTFELFKDPVSALSWLKSC